MGLVGPSPTTRKSNLPYNINNSSIFQVSSCQFCTDQYHAVSTTCTTQCFHASRATCAHKIAMQRPQVDLAVKCRLKRVWVFIRVFYTKNEVPIVSELPRFAREGENSPLPHPPPLGGPNQFTNPTYATVAGSQLAPETQTGLTRDSPALRDWNS